MGSLDINYDETRNVGNNINSKQGEFVELLAKVKSANDSLTSCWAGSDASRYSSAVEVQLQTMNELADVINEAGNLLVKAADAYQGVSESNASRININS